MAALKWTDGPADFMLLAIALQGMALTFFVKGRG
jgi:hypothetical protein